MNIEYILGVIVGIVVALALAFIFFYLANKTKKRNAPCEFDERQNLVRGKGFKYGFFTLLAYDFLFACFDELTESSYCDTVAGMVIGIALALIVWGVYCIWNDAYMSMSERPLTIYLLLGGVGGLNLLCGIMRGLQGEILIEGRLTGSAANLIIGIVFAVLLAVFVTKNGIDARNAD